MTSNIRGMTSNAEKKEAIAKLEKDIELYLKQGGKVKKLKPGEAKLALSKPKVIKNILWCET